MKVRWYVGGVVLVVGFAVTPVSAQERLVHQDIDRNTGATTRVFKTNEGGRIEVETGRLKVTKSVVGQRVVTRITEPGDDLAVTVDEKTFVVVASGKRLAAARTDRDSIDRARQLIAASVVGRKAADLIGKMGFGSATPVQPMLLTTRAFILSAAGDSSGNGDLARWARSVRPREVSPPNTIRAAWLGEEQDKSGSGGGMTPTDCWNAYTKEAIAAFIEYEDCMKDVKWWDVLGHAGCAAIYDMRAVGAFSWWLKCVALN